MKNILITIFTSAATAVFVGAVIINTTTKAVTTVKWDVPNVRVTLIKEVNSNPHTYEIVRVLASSTPNVGTFKWSKPPSDKGTNLYVEIECLPTSYECHAVPLIGPFTVK